jgi:hypothetical protein
MDLWLKDAWPLANRKLSWVIEKFNPPRWEAFSSKPNDCSIIYYTDNSIDGTELQKKVQERLEMAAEGKPIISISQRPISFGRNIIVGDIGRSHHSLFTQVLVGAEAATTKYVALAEHDCMYTPEHFNWTPLNDTTFWYNVNLWFVEWRGGDHDGLYSYQRRKCMSSLICDRRLLIAALKEKILMLESGFEIRKGQPGACEPGVCDDRVAFIEAKAKWIENNYKEACNQDLRFKDVGKEVKWKAAAFRTELPNLDIRHGGNFSGMRRAKEQTYSLPYWGEFKYIMNGGE